MDLRGRRVLAMRPDRADITFLKLFGARPMTFDLMPRGAPDMVGDLAKLRLPNDRFDMVFSNVMLATARDPEAAVREIARVVRPDGVALFYESAELGRSTREVTDHAERIAWYGQEMFERYGVGLYREWGFGELEALLRSVFHVRLVEAVDPPTARRFVWFWCTRRPSPEGPFLDDAGRAVLLGAHGAPELRGRPPFRCALCGHDFEAADENACPACGAGSQARGLPELARYYLPQVVDAEAAATRPLLALNLPGLAADALAPQFPSVQGATTAHADALPAAITEAADASLAGVAALDLLDDRTDHEALLREMLRAVAPGGCLAVSIRPQRLRWGGLPPTAEATEAGSGTSVVVGKEWLLDAMTRAGWAAGHVQVHDPVSGAVNVWFLGRRPG
jgi:SAM-dependent methyltransferase